MSKSKNQKKKVSKHPIGIHGHMHCETDKKGVEHCSFDVEVIYDDMTRGPLTPKDAKELGLNLPKSYFSLLDKAKKHK